MATKEQGKDVAVKEQTGGVPSYLQGYSGPRTEDNFDSSDVVIPRIKLLQGLSGECEAFEDARPGRFWHTGMDLNLGEQVEFVIISRKKKYLLVAPIEDGQGILARAEDFLNWDRLGKWEVKVDKKTTVTWEITDTNVVKSGLDQWGTYDPNDQNSPPAATLFYEYLVLLPEHLDLGPALLSLTRSQIKAAKKGLNDKIKLHQGAGRPMQALNFLAKSVGDKNDDGQDFKNLQFTGNGFVSEDLFKMALGFADTLKDYKVQDEAGAASEGERKKAESEDF